MPACSWAILQRGIFLAADVGHPGNWPADEDPARDQALCARRDYTSPKTMVMSSARRLAHRGASDLVQRRGSPPHRPLRQVPPILLMLVQRAISAGRCCIQMPQDACERETIDPGLGPGARVDPMSRIPAAGTRQYRPRSSRSRRRDAQRLEFSCRRFRHDGGARGPAIRAPYLSCAPALSRGGHRHGGIEPRPARAAMIDSPASPSPRSIRGNCHGRNGEILGDLPGSAIRTQFSGTAVQRV